MYLNDYTHSNIYMYVHVIIYMYMYVHVIIYMYMYVHVIIYMYMYVHVIIYMYMYVHVIIYYTCTCTYIYRLDAESNGSTQWRNPRGPRLSASRAKRGRY